MGNRKIVVLLRSFQSWEMRDFRDFVDSSYFNRKEELGRLLDVLNQTVLSPDAGPVSKEAIYARLYPDAPYDDKHFRYLTSDLAKLAERFLVLQQYEADLSRREIDLLQCYVNRNLEKGYARQKRRAEQALAAAPVAHIERYHRRMLLSEIEENRFVRQLKRTFNPHIESASRQLDHYYFAKKLHLSCAMLDRQAFIQGTYEPNLSKELLAHLRRHDFFGQELIAFYHTILQTLQDESNEAHYRELRRRLFSPSSALARSDLKGFFLYGINYCARMIRQGKTAFVNEALDLYIEGIDKGILFEEGYLSPWTFTNVVKLALRLQRYTWIEDFIRQYAEKLTEEFRQNALHYNLAELYYYTKRYDEAFTHLNQVALSDLNYHLGVRVMLAKIYYEKREEEALLSLIAAFSIFLKRNKKISQDLKRTYLHFCELLFEIIRSAPDKMEALRRKIKETPLLTDRSWLLEVAGGKARNSGKQRSGPKK